MSMEDRLVPNRECGSCSACCVSLHINEPELQKHADIPCPNLSSQGGCGIYPTRPGVCKGWYCVWRLMPSLGDEWRPDKCKVLIRLEPGVAGFTLQPLDSPNMVLTKPEVLQLVGAAIDGGGEVFISIPTRPGWTSAKTSLNAPMFSAIQSRDFRQLHASMLAAIEAAQSAVTEEIPNFKIPLMHKK